MKLSIGAARTLLLAAQGLETAKSMTASAGNSEPTCKEDVRQAIQRMGLLQIDTISVVARSPYLVLWSRLGDYEPCWLDELLAEGELFEYWSHAACFLPIEDFAIYRRRMLEYADGDAYLNNGDDKKRAAIAHVLAHIREHGAARSAHFERVDGKGQGWWDWKPEKIALEHLYNAGALMIARREGFQRIYDLRERVLPDWDDADALPREAGQRSMTLKALKALGVAKPNWLSDYFFNYFRSRSRKREITALLQSLEQEGLALPVTVEGWDEPGWIPSENVTLAEQAMDGALTPTRTTLLSPFDPVISNRARALELFGFGYRIETYTPAAKREYGYFSLPILHRGALVGRLDAKAHRREKRFEIKSLHLEDEALGTETLATELAATLRACANWHKTPEVVVNETASPNFAPNLRAALNVV